jgi:hypothetical protein
MAEKKSLAERRAARSAIFAGHQRHRRGRPFTETPRVDVEIVPTSVTPPHEIEAQRVRPDHGAPPAADATFTPASNPSA